jgi:hypothetical protein
MRIRIRTSFQNNADPCGSGTLVQKPSNVTIVLTLQVSFLILELEYKRYNNPVLYLDKLNMIRIVGLELHGEQSSFRRYTQTTFSLSSYTVLEKEALHTHGAVLVPRDNGITVPCDICKICMSRLGRKMYRRIPHFLRSICSDCLQSWSSFQRLIVF